MRQARYFGRTKTLFQLLMAATVANLTLVATRTGLMRDRNHPQTIISIHAYALFVVRRVFATLSPRSEPEFSATLLGELQQLASRLAEQFPWREAQATAFILSGAPPLVPPVTVRYTRRSVRVHLEPSDDTERFTYGEVIISAAPWVSEKLVAEAYYNIQSRILRSGQNRPLERRRLELLRFVIQRENPVRLTRATRRRIGKELVEAWDRKFPNWAYGNNPQPTSAYWEAYNDAERQLLHPSWAHPRKVG